MKQRSIQCFWWIRNPNNKARLSQNLLYQNFIWKGTRQILLPIHRSPHWNWNLSQGPLQFTNGMKTSNLCQSRTYHFTGSCTLAYNFSRSLVALNSLFWRKYWWNLKLITYLQSKFWPNYINTSDEWHWIWQSGQRLLTRVAILAWLGVQLRVGNSQSW